MPVEHQQQPVSGVVLKPMYCSAGIFQLKIDGGLTDAAAHLSRSHVLRPCRRLPAGLKPRQFFPSQHQLADFSIADFMHCVPSNVAATKLGLSCRSVEAEHPLLAECVLKVAEVHVRIIAIDDRRIAAGHAVVVANLKQWV